MRLRELIASLSLAVAASNAQAEKIPVLAIVDPVVPLIEMTRCAAFDAPPTALKMCAGLTAALFKELRRLGYIEGRSLLIERFSGEEQAEHYLRCVPAG